MSEDKINSPLEQHQTLENEEVLVSTHQSTPRNRLDTWATIREIIYAAAAVAGILAVVFWIFERDQRHDDRILRKIQLSADAQKIISRAKQAETEMNILAPSEIELGLALQAISNSNGKASIWLDHLRVDCTGNIIKGPLETRGSTASFSNCKFPDKGEIKISDSKRIEFSDVLIGPRFINSEDHQGNFWFNESSLKMTRLSIPNNWEGFISFRKTRVENLSISRSLSGRGGGWREIYSIPFISENTDFVFSFPNHGCELVSETKKPRRSFKRYECNLTSKG